MFLPSVFDTVASRTPSDMHLSRQAAAVGRGQNLKFSFNTNHLRATNLQTQNNIKHSRDTWRHFRDIIDKKKITDC